ncbi:MAG: SDR family oxidoreductase [Hoeflea sp.]|uniref:SDR family NAD(P)-dependent oxidoreductase n=1 Tax=Hoeflea sp. TaxID=1940281 RepID=UPI001D1EDEE3|nr:SDR family oxidoreductase [Hoeflea sp.]MBU4529128.1 SDR family oxidoreductase [Alphaproteobacteria bacterium]MBU4543533.1 SDR family oxidoreductase [Alphaproteobacteria bacterium]MBU4549158.1 SDR family oxidoreductase [Alphaproteobacteria bacterium]MBV1725293.1 SDR family oxidoreductase [Hoeflea sp.]MBV1785254.1 SDR family oxidoreductase [Hoeflea sp.]
MIGGRSRRILITGGNAGLGLALAKKLARHHKLLLSGRKSQIEVSDTLPRGAGYIVADQADPEMSTLALVRGIRDFGWDSLDNAVLNAGIGVAPGEGFDSTEAIRQTLDVNLMAAILQAQALFPLLEKSKGTLTFIGSVVHTGSATIPAYAASKAGLHGLARALRSEWKGKISVQVLHPGPAKTGIHDKAGYDPGRMRALFLKSDDMASMMASAIASRRSPLTLSWVRYLNGGAILGRRL